MGTVSLTASSSVYLRRQRGQHDPSDMMNDNADQHGRSKLAAVKKACLMTRDEPNPNSDSAFNWRESLRVAIDAAEAAARVLLGRFRLPAGTLKVNYKGSGELVTDADLAADRAIADLLMARGVEGNIVSEETSCDKGDGQLTWLIDPLCGTLPFSTGLAQWGVNIALSVQGQLEVGVIALPATGEVLSAARDQGAFLNGKRLDSQEPSGNLPAVPLAFEGDRRRFTVSQRALEHAAGRQYTFASAAYPVAQLLLGRIHGYVGRELNVHTAAGAVIGRELGIRVTDETGGNVNWPPDVSSNALVIAWPRTHITLLSRLP